MYKKIFISLIVAAFCTVFTCFAEETFEYGNILYTVDLVTAENSETSELTLTATSYLKDTDSPIPATMLASDIYEIMGYSDDLKESTDISKAIAALGESPITVIKGKSLVPSSANSGGGYTDENDLFIPDSLEDISKEAAEVPAETKPASNEIKVVLHGIYTFEETAVSFPDQKPIIVDGRTLVPARGVFEDLGYTVEWDAATASVTVTGNKKTVQVSIGSATIYIDGEPSTLDVPAQIIGGRTMLPLRAISWGLGLQVEWEGVTKTVKIYYK